MAFFLWFVIVTAGVSATGIIILLGIANGFSAKLLEYAFQAAAGSAVSLFILLKAIWVDAPKPDEFSSGTSYFLDTSTGSLRSPIDRKEEDRRERISFYGIRSVEGLSDEEWAQRVHLKKRLMEAYCPVAKVRTAPIEVMEFLIIRWIAHNWEAKWGLKPAEPIRSYTGYAWKMRPAFDEKDWTEKLKVSGSKNEGAQNILFQESPIELEGPKGLFLRRRIYDDQSVLKIALESPFTKTEMTIFALGDAEFDFAKNSKALRTSLKLSGGDWRELSFYVTFEISPLPMRRFSRRAEIELDWLRAVAKSFPTAFRTHHGLSEQH